MRIKIVRTFFLLAFLTVLVRLFYWQVIRSEDMMVKAEQQHITSSKLEAPRGNIYSSDGSLLATNKPKFLMYGLPKIVENKSDTARILAQIIGESDYAKVIAKNKQDQKYALKYATNTASLVEDIEPSLTDQQIIIDQLREVFETELSKNLYWVSLKRNIDSEVKAEIEKAKIEGIGFDNSLVRFYPESSSSAHLLGFVGSDEFGKETGYFGLEGFYNKELRGVGGQLVEEKDARGIPILSDKFAETGALSGHDIILNIDRSVQYIAEKHLREGLETYGAKSGSVVIIDPKTGAILAMASYPNYDPNIYYNFPNSFYGNPITSESYEPGSTFKTVIMSAAINEKAVTPETVCDICAGPVEASGYLIRTWNNKYFPDSTMSEVILHSDNTGMVFVARKLGLDKIYQYIEDFGFGNLTGVDLQDEATPELRHKDQWREIDLATASFGQGIAVTPIQMVRAVATIANKGVMMQPKVVKAVKTEQNTVEIQPKVLGHPISESTAKTMTEMMVNAVKNGEAGRTAPKGYKIAGKTGTAQVPIKGVYEEGKYVASFVGFAPADDPKFVMLVKYTEPQQSIYGTSTAAPTFFQIAKELFVYYNIAPDE